jgi:Zn-dependent M28 family amino/carboxypeptidase
MAAARPLPKRSVLFAAVGAEESGLIGSRYFCHRPTVGPAGRIAANLNIDGMNIWGRTHDVTFVGMGKSSLDEVLVPLAKTQGRVVKPDQFPDRGHFYRSDQFNFARIGVPAIYLDAGTDFVGRPPQWGKEHIEAWEKTRYHQPSDHLDDSWNLEGALDDIRLLLVAGMRIADAPKMPAWKAGDEFEAARKKAIESLKSQAAGQP